MKTSRNKEWEQPAAWRILSLEHYYSWRQLTKEVPKYCPWHRNFLMKEKLACSNLYECRSSYPVSPTQVFLQIKGKGCSRLLFPKIFSLTGILAVSVITYLVSRIDWRRLEGISMRPTENSPSSLGCRNTIPEQSMWPYTQPEMSSVEIDGHGIFGLFPSFRWGSSQWGKKARS